MHYFRINYSEEKLIKLVEGITSASANTLKNYTLDLRVLLALSETWYFSVLVICLNLNN